MLALRTESVGHAPPNRPTRPRNPSTPPPLPHVLRAPRLLNDLTNGAVLERQERNKSDGEEECGVDEEGEKWLERVCGNAAAGRESVSRVGKA